jgi:hypothetical protein
MNVNRIVVYSGVLLCAAVLAGCGENARNSSSGDKEAGTAGRESPSAVSAKSGEKSAHVEWWCSEHGMPEEICAQCSAKLAADFKKKGDWCKEHDRPDSQCFICHPELKEKFAAQYRAKYGEEPPPIEEEDGEERQEHGDDAKEG